MKQKAELIRGKIGRDLEVCEESVKFFPSDNKFTTGIARCLKRIEDILKSEDIKDKSTLRHDIKNPLGAALGYVDMLKNKTEKEGEKFQAENISQSLKNILDKLAKV